jgi:hypothetical protein
VNHASLTITSSSQLSEVNDKLDSNIELAENLLDMLDSINNQHNDSSTKKIDVLHMYIRQFLIELDAHIRRDRKRRQKSKKKHKKTIYKHCFPFNF